MMEATRDFFEALGRRGHEPLLEHARGSIRVELVNDGRTDRWVVAVDKGDIAVSHKNAEADCTLRTSGHVFEELVRGEENAMAAALRGAVTVEGDPELLVLFQRLFPGPPAKRRSAGKAAAGRKRSR